ncbi:hypothetical protein AKJ16_DCAP25394 [Drosera capensis]
MIQNRIRKGRDVTDVKPAGIKAPFQEMRSTILLVNGVLNPPTTLQRLRLQPSLSLFRRSEAQNPKQSAFICFQIEGFLADFFTLFANRIVIFCCVMDLRFGLFLVLFLAFNSAYDARELPSSDFSGTTDNKVDVCALCEQYSTLALNYLSENKTQAEVIGVLHDACSQMQSLEKQMNSVRKLCENTKISYLLKEEDKCDLCHQAIDEVKLKLKDPDSKLEIMEIMLKACDALEDYIKKCKAMVFEYGPLILTNAEKFVESNDICTTLHACTSSTTEATSQDLSDSKILMVTSASS